MAKGVVGVGVAVRERAHGAQAAAEPPLTRFHQRIAAESIAARGSGGGPSRLAPALARSAVDLNPHQVEAAAFALGALATGGAVLADEVGLGKTIEAGLVMAQLAAEGRSRTLVLVPASLRIQWRDELRDKFGIQAAVVDGPSARVARGQGRSPFDTGGAVIASQPFAAQRPEEIARVPWDLAVVDEAHRLRNAWRPDHKTGQALRRALRRCPKLLLTATPLQNDLLELLGLTSFIDDALLGSEESFRLQYGTGELTAEKAADLRARLDSVVVRTLRRQVREYVRFTARRSLVEDFTPSPEEQQLYRRVGDWLRREDSLAIPRGRRALMVLVYRKILASSSFALAGTLERLADSVDARVAGAEACADATPGLDLEGFEEEAEEWGGEVGVAPRGSLRALRAEAAELRACARAASAIRSNAKGEALLRGLDRAFTVARACGWPEKAVVFTEFRRTQDHLSGLLRSRGHAVTCLSGDVAGPERRQALVEEFRDRSQVLLMTEAGAEGLNLQFCNLVVNYDLPWNPQRIEQRIGRCHRYGQERDVLVVNFLNRSNAADARLYELLGQKLSLFDGVFGSSDEILGSLGSGVDFERRVLDIYQSCRSADEVDRAFAALRGDLEARIQARLLAAREILFERFDGEVRARLRLAEREARDALARRRTEEEALVRSVFPKDADAERAALAEPGPARRARRAREAAEVVRSRPAEAVSFLELEARALPAALSHLAGREGWWLVYRFAFEGLAPEERVAHLVLWSDGDRFRELSPEAAAAVARLPAREASAIPGGALPLGSAQAEALARLEAGLAAEVAERGGAALDESRERWDRVTEEALDGPRREAEEARRAWERARGALHQRSELPLPERRAGLWRAERDYRRRLDALRAAEAQRYGEKDRALAELRHRADPRPRRSLVATAYWRCA